MKCVGGGSRAVIVQLVSSLSDTGRFGCAAMCCFAQDVRSCRAGLCWMLEKGY